MIDPAGSAWSWGLFLLAAAVITIRIYRRPSKAVRRGDR